MTRALVVLLVLSWAEVTAQRPRLRAGADTNDPAAFVQLGREMLLRTHPKDLAVAESSLVWAARLDPIAAEPLYLHAIAIVRPVLRDSIVAAYLVGILDHMPRRLTAQDNLRVDSLLREAWLRDPFYDWALDPLSVLGGPGSPYLSRDREERAFNAFFTGDTRQALDLWARTLEDRPERLDIRWHRVHTLYWLGQFDSTITELRAALASLARGDTANARVLPPIHLIQYALGIAHERAGRVDSASAEYRGALVRNLGLYMAHARLANILLVRGDTALALEEAAVAEDVAPHDPWLAGFYGSLLLQAGRPADAVEPLRRGIGLDSAYAVPYFLLGVAYAQLRRDPEALRSFLAFLDRAPRNEERRAWTTSRIAAIRAALDSTSRH